MKARTSGSGRTGCKAVQHSDQMRCDACGLCYDVNDPDPPECKPRLVLVSGRRYGRETLKRLLEDLKD